MRERSSTTNMENLKQSRTRAVITDPQLWLPIIVLILGIGVLVLVK
jgi:hypothetical protein